MNNSGYFIIGVTSKEKLRKTYSAHRFIWESIKGVIPEGFELHHRNEIKTDNSIQNLELVTHQQNVKHYIYKKYKKVVATKLETNEEKNFISIKLAGKGLGINQHNISSVCGKKEILKKHDPRSIIIGTLSNSTSSKVLILNL